MTGTRPSSTGVVVVGSCMADLVVTAPRPPLPGETIVGSDFSQFLGGKGFNQAVAARRAGARTALVARVGDDDFGHRFLAKLDEEGIDRRAVAVDTAVGTGVATPVVFDSGENSIIIVPRANSGMRPSDIESAAPVIGDAAVVLLQLELPTPAVVEAARVARDAGALVILNPAPAVDDLSAFVGLVDLVVPNEVEAAALAPQAATPAAAATALRDDFATPVIVTAGAAGIWLAERGEPELIPAHTVDAVDTVGAGDAFCGVLGARLASGSDLRSAVIGANAAAAIAVTVRGAEPSLPYADQVEALLGMDLVSRPAR